MYHFGIIFRLLSSKYPSGGEIMAPSSSCEFQKSKYFKIGQTKGKCFCTMASSSDSQITGSVSCLSLPSEPPDIRNWFSSYKYESFVLDTYDDFGGSLFQEERKEKEASVAESRRNVENDCSLENGFPSKMPDSRESPSLLSEPPHIKNWFSSYVYESPSRDAIDDFRSPATEESESKKGHANNSDGSPKVKERNFEESNGSGNCNEVAGENLRSFESAKCESTFGDCIEDDSLNRIPDFAQFSSLPSEPPDIRNWFSSFVYQSSLPCDINGFLEETARNEDGSLDEDSSTEKAINVEKVGKTRITGMFFHDKACANRFSKFSSPAGDDKEENKLHNERKKSARKEYLAIVEDLHCEREQSLKNKVLSVCLAKDAEKASLNDDDHICKRKNEQNCPRETGLFLFKNNMKTRITGGKSPRKLVNENDLTENLNIKPVTEVDLQSPIRLMRKLTNGADDKENKGNEVPGNGFVTMRKGRVLRSNDVNFNRKQLVVLGCSRNKGITSPDDERGVALKRKVLSERTNFDPTAKAIEITGKWHCPQKSKPNIRPPVKQLRLEQWFHKM